MTVKQKITLWLIDLFYYPLCLIKGKCTVDRAWLMQTWKDAKCKATYCETPAKIRQKMIVAGKHAVSKRTKPVLIQRILEPGYGCGELIKDIDAAFNKSKIIGIDIEHDYYKALRLEYLNHGALRNNMVELHNADFLSDLPAVHDMDLTFMNPPYANKQFIKHIKQAVRVTKPGGAIVALVPAAAFYSASWSCINFRSFLERYVETEVDLLGPVVCNYPVSVCMLRITKRKPEIGNSLLPIFH